MSTCVNWRALACARGESAEAGERCASTTERGRDKRAQCALRTVGCTVWSFLLSAQGARACCNVHPTRKSQTFYDLSHISEVGDGR